VRSGAYSVSNSYLDVVLMLGFGIVGYLFKKLYYPLAPLVRAIVIGGQGRGRISAVHADVEGIARNIF